MLNLISMAYPGKLEQKNKIYSKIFGCLGRCKTSMIIQCIYKYVQEWRKGKSKQSFCLNCKMTMKRVCIKMNDDWDHPHIIWFNVDIKLDIFLRHIFKYISFEYKNVKNCSQFLISQRWMHWYNIIYNTYILK